MANKRNVNPKSTSYLKTKPASKPAALLDGQDLPLGYDTTTLTLMPRDPHWLYAYWEISPSSVDQLRRKIGSDVDNPSMTLRMHDVTLVDFNGHNANRSFDIEVGTQANNWYINLSPDNVTYLGEIGVKTARGEFYPMTQSNVVTTPRASSSGRSDLIWMDSSEEALKPFVYTPINPAQAKSFKKEFSASSLPFEKNFARKYLTKNDISAYYADLFPVFKRTKAKHLKESTESTAQSLKNSLRAKSLERARSRQAQREEGLQNPLWPQAGFLKKWLGTSAEFVLNQEGGSETRLLAGSEHLVNPVRLRKFFFEIWMELIVYGRSEPDSKVMLGDKEIKLREDGTFTLRYLLPDGKIPFPFTAASADKIEQRHITTAVERSETKYKKI